MRRTVRNLTVACVLCVGCSAASPARVAFDTSIRQGQPLRVTEISPTPSAAGPPWIELINSSNAALSLDGMALVTASKRSWELPLEAFQLAANGFVLVYLDADEIKTRVERASPDLIVLHGPAALAQPWAEARSQLAVFQRGSGPSGGQVLVDYVAWGAPATLRRQKRLEWRGKVWSVAAQSQKGSETGPKVLWAPPQSNRRLPASIWPASWFVPLAESFGIHDPRTRLAPGASIGLYPGNPGGSPEDWAVFDPDEATPGKGNPVSRPKAFTPEDGAVVSTNTVAMGWARRKGDESYRFQLAADKSFSRVLVETTIVTPGIRIGQALPDGKYWYRVWAKAGMFESLPSTPVVIQVLQTTCDLPDATGLRDWLLNPTCRSGNCRVISAVRFKFQRKDTRLICCAEGCKTDRLRNRPHPFCQTVWFPTQVPGAASMLCADAEISKPCEPAELAGACDGDGCAHGSENCARASISMITSAYCRCLSQDRIAFEFRDPNWPAFDLGHAQPMDCYEGGQCSGQLRWALGVCWWQAIFCHHTYVFTKEKPPLLRVKEWIDDRRPIMTVGRVQDKLSHARVLVGYCSSLSSTNWLLVYDPLFGPQFLKYESWAPTATWVAPPVTTWDSRRVRSDEPSIWFDSNQDEVMDFDSTVRGLSPSALH